MLMKLTLELSQDVFLGENILSLTNTNVRL